MTLTLRSTPSAITPVSNTVAALASRNSIQQTIPNPMSSIGLTGLGSFNPYTSPLTVAPPLILPPMLNNVLGLQPMYSPWFQQGAQNSQNNQEQAKIAEQERKKGDGKTTVLNSTDGSDVSLMEPGEGNFLSQELKKRTSEGTNFGAAVNQSAGDTLSGGQKTTLRGSDPIADDLGSAANPVAENVVLADTHHGSDGSTFKQDGENITKASNAQSSSTFSSFSEFKDYLLERAAALPGKNLVVTIAAHGSPDGGVSVGGEHISKEDLNKLLDEAGVKLTINCPCYSQLGVA